MIRGDVRVRRARERVSGYRLLHQGRDRLSIRHHPTQFLRPQISPAPGQRIQPSQVPSFGCWGAMEQKTRLREYGQEYGPCEASSLNSRLLACCLFSVTALNHP
jgi:hypothetical protein